MRPDKPTAFRVIIDAESFCDGIYFDTFEEAKDAVIDILSTWEAEFWKDMLTGEDLESRESLCDAWNYFYDNNTCFVEALSDDWEDNDDWEDMYTEIDDLSEEELNDIMWVEHTPDDDYIDDVVTAMMLDI